MGVTWDPRKRVNNRRKHRIDFDEAATVLADPLGTTFPDPDHSEGEERYLTVGLSVRGRVLVVAHADAGEVIRIISARRATRRERSFYEE
jgi:uncharacterized protein